jgi:hypothetical protein
MSSRANGIVRMTLDMLKARGFTPTVSNGGKHLKIKWHDGGRNFCVVVSRSPSDRDAVHNARATLRRILRNKEASA